MFSVTFVYIIVAIIGVIIALILAYLGTLQSKGSTTAIGKTPRSLVTPPIIHSSINESIVKEIQPVLRSRKHSELISKKISHVFNKELEKRINLTAQEISKKYNALIEEKTRNEEIALKKYKKAIVEKRDTEAVIRSIAEGLVVVDAEGKVIMMNPAAEKLLGVEKENTFGKKLTENLKEEQLISLIKSSPDKENKEIELSSPDDETKKVLRASSAVIEDENGKTVGMVSVLSDITKQRELERMKSNFIASVSHELRTPLIAIEKSVSLLLSKTTGPISETQEQFLKIAHRNLKRLSRLINDLLDLSKLEAKKMALERKISSIKEIIDETMETFNTWAETKSITLEKRIEENIPMVNVDPSRITQVLTNLIGNAIKFTPQGGAITVEAHHKKDASCIEVSVADTGIGIDKQYLEKIFDRFYQTTERATTDISGTGLGLSICKELIELHGGKIWAESEKGYGAKFIFTLPLTTNSNTGG